MSRIVEMKDTGPLVLKKDEMEDDVVAVCRCGLSADWPYCDGSHANTRDEDGGDGEGGGGLVAYRRKDGELVRIEVEDLEPGEADPRA